jgi:hypothetical protein
MKDTAKAIEDFRSAIEADPDELRAYEELARALRSSDRNAEADSVQQKGAKIAKWKEEAQKLRASLWEDPYNEKMARHLAELLREEGREDDASIVLAASLEARQAW